MTRLSLVAIVLLALLASAGVAAQTPDDDARAQRLIDQATLHFETRDFARALEHYEEAYHLMKDARLLLMVGRCHQELEHWSEAREVYVEVLQDPALPDEARGRTEMALRVVQERLSKGTLLVQVSPFGAQVFVDGGLVGEAPLDALPVVPGRHRIRVEKDGMRPVDREVVVRAGSSIRVDVALESVAPPEPPVLISQPAPAPVEDEGFRYSWYAWTTTGVTAAALGTGIAFLVLGKQQADDASAYSQRADADREVWRDMVDEGDRDLLVSYVSFGVAGAAAIATGLILGLENRDSDDSGEPRVSLAPMPRADGVQLVVKF